MVSFVVLILLMNAVMGVNFVQQMTEMYDESINIMKEMVSNMPAGTNTAGTEQMIKTFDDMGKTMNFIITNVFPAILVVASVVTSYINYLVASKFAKRFSISIRQHEGLSYFSFPRTFMAAMAALLILSFVLNLFNINVSLIQVNLFMIVFAAMFFQGFAVLKFFLMRSSINKTLRTIILAMVLLMSGGFAQMLAIVGLVDLAIDLRKIK